MAVIKRGILGGFQNKIGNVVGSSWKGISTMRSLPVSVANPRTAPQVTQRNKFSETSKFASQVLARVIKPFWDRFAQQESGYNAFIRRNIENFSAAGLTNFANLKISEGTVTPAPITAASVNAANNSVTLTVANIVEGDSLETDYLVMVFYNRRLKIAYTRNFNDGRADLGAPFTWIMPFDILPGDTMDIYTAMRRADGTKTSNTEYRSAVAA